MEQKTKHTPGPWMLTKEKHGIIEEFVIAGLSYGNANDQNYLILAENGDDSQQYSNALLVRAAPDMLNALEAYRSTMPVLIPLLRRVAPSVAEKIYYAHAKAYNAIVKAEGWIDA